LEPESSIETRTALQHAYAVLRVALLVAVIVYLVWRVVSGREALAVADPEWTVRDLGFAFVAAVLAYQCLPAAWLLLLQRLGLYQPGQLRTYSRIWWTSYLYRYVPGKVMLVVERARLGVAAGIPAVVGGGLTFVETLLSILSGSVVALLAASYYTAGDGAAIAVLVLVTTGALMLLPTLVRRLKATDFVRRRFPNLDRIELNRGDLAIVTLPYVAHYLLLGLSFFFLARGLGTFEMHDLAGLCGIYALSHVVSVVVLVAPAGLGVREGALAVQLNRVLPGGVAEALAIGVRVWFTAIELLCFVIAIAAASGQRPASIRDERTR